MRRVWMLVLLSVLWRSGHALGQDDTYLDEPSRHERMEIEPGVHVDSVQPDNLVLRDYVPQTVILTGSNLERISGVQVYPINSGGVALAVTLDPASAGGTRRTLAVRRLPEAAAGSYSIALSLNAHSIPLPLEIMVPSGILRLHNTPSSEAAK